ncbi:MAG: DNA methyltransferase [Ardenticatenaceae bacterium]|nr:DNA methyltransferase [Ardenticatenaceae bacterium]
MTPQAPLPGIDSAGQPAAENAGRAVYRERLRQYLQDPAFRAIEGFPIGDDEAILALSDPPFYTACPNPFLPEIVAGWKQERAGLRVALGLPDDSHDNGNGAPAVYQREPFAADVAESRNNKFVNAHSYATKVPHQAIMTFLLHFTQPGDIVYDGFGGTGMTAVAAQLCGKPERDFKERIEAEFKTAGLATPQWGERHCIVGDLSPAAVFIAANFNLPFNEDDFNRAVLKLYSDVVEECGWMYETRHWDGRVGRIHATIWSDVFVCSECGGEIVFWDAAVDISGRRVLNKFPCPHCKAVQSKSDAEHAWTTKFDHALNMVIRQIKMVPVFITYALPDHPGRFEKRVDEEDLERIREIESREVPYWYPIDRMPEGDESRRNDKFGFTHIHHFFTRRNLWSLAAAFSHADSLRLKFLLTSLMYKSSILCAPLLSNYFAEKAGQPRGGWVGKERSGTLYCPSVHSEVSVTDQILSRLSKMNVTAASSRLPCLQVASATSSFIPSNTVDYVFTDPPFGANRMYSELNFLWEAWLRVRTDNELEAIKNRVQGKSLLDYQRLMERCFHDYHRVLKPGRWITVEFSNTKAAVWNAIQTALSSARFVVADVRALDKKQGSIAQYTTTTAMNQDLIISAYKPRVAFERRFLEQAGRPEGAWDFVRQHLAQLPVVVENAGVIETIAERQPYLLFDRMVAFHIQRGATVPLSAAEFYAGLRQRFAERDGMFFLADQVPQYDAARLRVGQIAQLTLFVSDEKSTIQWLRQQLDPATGGQPQTYQDLQPQFLRQLHQARHEALPEPGEILEQNFLQDDAGRWYVPDPNKASDLEKIRQKALLREFARYAEARGRLRQFRTEAVRAGFADAWRRRDFATIVKVAERLPESVLQEDQELLMYYDNASLRAE